MNLQILWLIGFVEGLYDLRISNVELTILAHGYRQLVKVDLSECEGSYDKEMSIDTYCPMHLEVMTLYNH